MNNKEEILCKHVEYNDIANVRKLLDQGANPTVIISSGLTAIGLACLKKYAVILKILLESCAEYQPMGSVKHTDWPATAATAADDVDDDSGESEAKKWKRIEEDITPEGMEGLQWEDEIMQQKSKEETAEDEWSVLYRYYASVIEKTGEMLANTISAREPHCLDAFQQAPIHYAATVGTYDCMELLLKHNAPINMTTNTGYTALHLAVEQPQIIALLLQYKANPNKMTFYDQLAPIHMAAKIGIIETIQLLKDAGANINITTLADQTPLHLAITYQQYEAAVRLIHCGAKINLEDEKGLTPLYTAIVMNDYRLAKTLLSHGARLLPSQYLLNYTIRNRMTAMTRLLIKAGENVNGRDYIGWTPVLLAINQRDIEVIEYLLANGAKINRNDYVLKELHIAVQQSSSIDEFRKLFGILMRHGVHVDSLNKWGETPLCLAVLMEKYQIAEYLIKEGANVNGGCSIKAKDCMLLVRECNNINLIRLFVNAGLRLWEQSVPERPPPSLAHRTNAMSDSEIDCCETYLWRISTVPLSLKQWCRIAIRQRLIAKMRNFNYVNEFILSATPSQSVLHDLVVRLNDLPRILQHYLYAFPDIPSVPNDIDVFVNY